MLSMHIIRQTLTSTTDKVKAIHLMNDTVVLSVQLVDVIFDSIVLI